MSQRTATQLKEEGNVLFAKMEYEAASLKYTEAIALDGENAILYANRAASRLGLRQYLDAHADASKATEIDPKYHKAWARLAKAEDALKTPHKSVVTWQKALETLPKTKLTAADQKLKTQYSEGLKEAKISLKRLEEGKIDQGIIVPAGLSTELPWVLAKKMQPELISRQMELVHSSAWVILEAYENFSQGMSGMKQLKKIPTSRGMTMMGRLDVLTDLTNAIMIDVRVFHISDPNFIKMYNDQVILEIQQSRAWSEAGPDIVKQEALKRLDTESWDTVRPALSTTIRGWIMRGFFSELVASFEGVKLEFLSRALEIIDWGRRVWADVPTSARGVIFEETFARGLRSMHLQALMDAYATDPGPNSKFPLQNLLEEANSILREEGATKLDRSESITPGFCSAFHVYPYAHAHAMIGFYHAQMSKFAATKTDAEHHSRQAATAYINAGTKYPDDDEHCPFYLKFGLDHLALCHATIGEALLVIMRAQDSIPKMNKIWKNSSLAKGGRDEMISSIQETVMKVMRGLELGTYTLDDLLPI